MQIRNKSRRFAANAEVAETFFSKARGLMFCSKPKPMLFRFGNQARHGFWMLFMRFPIDMVFIDKSKRVVDIRHATPVTRNPKTWKIYKPKKPCMYVLELPSGNSKHLKIGDRLDF